MHLRPNLLRWLWLALLCSGLPVPDVNGVPLIAQAGLRATATPLSCYLYTGEQMDPDLGMYYLRARYYQPSNGRFWTLDSFEGPQNDPLSLHKYAYCRGDPVNRSDPSGYSDTISFGAAMSSFSGMVATVAFRAAPIANKITIILYESISGTTFVGGAGLLAGGKVAVTVVGGVTKFIDPLAKAHTEKIALAGFKEAGKYGVWPFKVLKKLVPSGSGLEKHHLVEKRFKDILQVSADDIPSIALTTEEHAKYTARWLAEIGRRNMDVPITTQTATVENVWHAAQEVYHDAPELLEFVKVFLGK